MNLIQSHLSDHNPQWEQLMWHSRPRLCGMAWFGHSEAQPGVAVPHRKKAFTLLELLVATLIFSVLIGALYSVLFGAIRLRETAHEAIESRLPREQLAGVVRRDLINMVVPAGLLAGALTGTAEDDGELHLDTVAFYTTTGTVTAAAPWGEIQKVEYTLEVPEEGDATFGYDLMRQATRNLLPSTVVEETSEEQLAQWRLARGVVSLEIAYWDGEEWLDEWDTTTTENENPKAVWLKVEFFPGAADVAGAEPARAERPLELICEIAPRPRPTPAAAAGGEGPAPTPQPTPQPTPPPGPNPNPTPPSAPGGGDGGR